MDTLINELTNAIGLKLDQYQRKFLEKRVDFRMKYLNLLCYQDYIDYIRKNPIELDLFLEKFTINYTYFFRNYSVFENFEKYINCYAKQYKKPLRIWSAPCATGDEPYTVAIVLDKLKKMNNDFPDYKIIGSDIDPKALEVAKEGVYGEYSVHETPEFYVKTYFSRKDTEIGPKFTLSEEIKNKVELLQEDIIKSHNKDYKYDVIFCRNFFIYINQYAREKLLNNLESRLHDGGLLILGGSETLPQKNGSFQTISMRDRFYVKNLDKLNKSFKIQICGLFKIQVDTKTKKPLQNRRKITQSIKSQRRELKTKAQIIENANKISKKVQVLEEELEEKHLENEQFIQDLNKIEKIEAEVKITGIVVNENSSENENNKSNGSKKNSAEDPKISSIKIREKKIKQRELLLTQREEEMEQRIAYLDAKYQKIEEQRTEVDNLFQEVKEQEEEVKNRISILERLTKQVEQREKLVEHKEEQFQQRLKQVGEYKRQLIQQEVQINGISKDAVKKEDEIDNYEDKRIDRIERPNDKRELVIAMGHYGLINSFDKYEVATKFIVKGVGSGIILILKDPTNHIFGMSYISLPSASASKQGYHLLFPHTFVDTSIKDLYNNLLYNGANKENITALIVGGAKLFLDYDMTYQENINAIKGELERYEIGIEAEDVGGLSERAIIYDTLNEALFVKKTWEFEYRRI